MSWYFVLDMLTVVVAICKIILRYGFDYQISALNFLILIKVLKAAGYDRLITKYVIRSTTGLLFYVMLKNLVLLTFICHTIGSFFFFIDLRLIELKWYPDSMLWVKSSYAYEDILSLPLFYQYSYSFYYAVITLTGTAYGDLTPLNPTETAYTLLSVALPMIIYSYFFSVIYNAIYEQRKPKIEALRHKKQAKNYFRDIGLTDKQASKFMNYLSFVYDKKVAVDLEFMEEVAPSIREAYLRTNLESNFDFSVFMMLTRPSFEIDVIKELVCQIIEEDIYPAKHSFSCRNKMYFISSGQVSKLVQLQKTHSVNLRQPGLFGMF